MGNVIRATNLRHKHIGRSVTIDDAEGLEDFGLESVTGTIEALSMWDKGVSIGVDYLDPSEGCIVSLDVELALDSVVTLGGA